MSKFCPKCGSEVQDNATFCSHCGAQVGGETGATYETSNKSVKPQVGSTRSRGLALILACIGAIGFAGIHRFYVGKIGTGILWLLTGGCCGIGTIIDVIMIATGDFTDIDGEKLVNWNID